MKIFSEDSHLGIVAAMMGCCRAGWWMNGRCSLWNINKLKHVRKIMRKKITQENICSKGQSVNWICFTWGKAVNTFSPYWCHMSCLLCPGFAGMKLVPGARTVKIYQMLSCKKLTWMPCSDKSCWRARRWTTSCRVLSMTGRVRHWGTVLSSTWGNRDW